MRYLLAFFFLMMYAGDQLGLNISLGPGMSTKNLLIYVMFAAIALNTAVARNRSFDLPSIAVPFLILIVYAIVTWIFAAFIFPDPNYSPRVTLISLKSSLVDQYLTFLIFLFGVIHARDADWLLRAILWVTILGNVITLVDTFNVPNLGILENAARKAGRFDGFVGQPNAYGKILVLFLPATIVLAYSRSGKQRVFAYIGVIAAAMALLLTGSRGSWAGLIFGSGIAAFYLRKYVSKSVVLKATGTAMALLVLTVAITTVAGYEDVYLNVLEKFEGSEDTVSSGRISVWTAALVSMLEHPWSFITGYGYFAYSTSVEFRAAMHNHYLGYLYDLGLIGLMLLLFIFIRTLSVARSRIAGATDEHRQYLMALVFGLCAFLITMVFSEYNTTGYLLWAYIGVTMRIAMLGNADTVEATVANPKRGP